MQGAQFNEDNRKRGYSDVVDGAKIAFGKIYSAKRCELYLTELEYWAMLRVYEWDSAEALSGYETATFYRPTDFSILSVMEFFKAKNEFKRFMHDRKATDYTRAIAPAYLVNQMEEGTATADDVAGYYQYLKSDLNALYGIEITNEAKPDQYISDWEGIRQCESAGIDDLPKFPKTWYQFGQRIVGWSRIAQVVNMELIAPYVDGIINGDTDSIKVLTSESRLSAIDEALARYSESVERARGIVCSRVKNNFPDNFSALDGMGGYELEFTSHRYMSAWNKAYCIADDGYNFVLAGMPTSRGTLSVNEWANAYEREGRTFAETVHAVLGYNVTISPELTELNGRKLPAWGTWFTGEVTDYLGNAAEVCEPSMVALYPEPKTIGDTATVDNARNCVIARANNKETSTDAALLYWHDGKPIREVY